MATTDETQASPTRLRFGVLMFALWWLPVWALAPIFAEAFKPTPVSEITVYLIVIQSVIGLLGVVIAGKQVMAILRNTGRKAMPKAVWHVLLHGNVDVPKA